MNRRGFLRALAALAVAASALASIIPSREKTKLITGAADVYVSNFGVHRVLLEGQEKDE